MASVLKDWLAPLIEKELENIVNQTAAKDTAPSTTLETRTQDGSNLRIPVERQHNNAVQIHKRHQFRTFDNPVTALVSDAASTIVVTFSAATADRFFKRHKKSITQQTVGNVFYLRRFEIVATPYGPADEKLTLLVTDCFTRGLIDQIASGQHELMVIKDTVKGFLSLLEAEKRSSRTKPLTSDEVQDGLASSSPRFTTQLVDHSSNKSANGAGQDPTAREVWHSRFNHPLDRERENVMLPNQHHAQSTPGQDILHSVVTLADQEARLKEAVPIVPVETSTAKETASKTPASTSVPAYYWSTLPYLGKDTTIPSDQESALSKHEALLRPGSQIPVANMPPRQLKAFHRRADKATPAGRSVQSVAQIPAVPKTAPAQVASLIPVELTSALNTKSRSPTPQSSPYSIPPEDWPSSSPPQQMPPDTPIRITSDQDAAANSDPELELAIPMPSKVTSAGVFKIASVAHFSSSPHARSASSRGTSPDQPSNLVLRDQELTPSATHMSLLASSPPRAAASREGRNIGVSPGVIIPCTAEPKSMASPDQSSSGRTSSRQPLSQSSGQPRSQSDKGSQLASTRSNAVITHESDKENGETIQNIHPSIPSESSCSPPSARRESLKRKRDEFSTTSGREPPKVRNHFGFSQESPPTQGPLEVVKAERTQFMSSIAAVHAVNEPLMTREHPQSGIERSSSAENIYATFASHYPDYSGDFKHFTGVCRTLDKLRRERGFHRHLWDDYIIRHKTQYSTYLLECAENVEDPTPYDVFYEQEVDSPMYTGGIMNHGTLNIALGLISNAFDSSPLSIASKRSSATPQSVRPMSERFQTPYSVSSRSLAEEPFASSANSLKSLTLEQSLVPAQSLEQSPLPAVTQNKTQTGKPPLDAKLVDSAMTSVLEQSSSTKSFEKTLKSSAKRPAELTASPVTSTKKPRSYPWPSSVKPARTAESAAAFKRSSSSARPRYSDPTPLAKVVLKKQVRGNPHLPNLSRIAKESPDLEPESLTTYEAFEGFLHSYSRIKPSGAFAEQTSTEESTLALDMNMNVLDWSL